MEFLFSWRLLRWVVLMHMIIASFRAHAQDDYSYNDPVLNSVEESAVYDVLEAINPEVDWKSSYPDNLCTGGPHGVVCDIGKEDGQWHVVELNLGWVSDYSNNPTCSPSNASFTPSIQRLSHLRKLFLYSCFSNVGDTVVLPPYVWRLGAQLQQLVIQDNPALHGSLDSSMRGLVGLNRLIISGTSVGGSIPEEIGQLNGLKQLVLSGNKLNGSIPTSVGELQDLVILDLSRNNLMGSLPADLGNLKKLSKLDLSFNRLDGSVPNLWGGLGNSLLMLDLSFNNISGGIPLFLGGFNDLEDLHMSRNPLGGELPDYWVKLRKLKTLGLSNAGLVGDIPDSMASLKSLTYLALGNNSLSGNIPRGFGSFPGIYNMDLSRNQLSGLVPFSSEFVGKIGSKLQLAGNSGLCYGSSVSGVYSVGLNLSLNLSYCNDDNPDVSKVKFEVMLSGGASVSMTGKTMLLIVFSLIVVCVRTNTML